MGGLLIVTFSLSAPALPAAPRKPLPGAENLTFYHWWVSPSESAALNALVELFKTKYPDVTVFATPAQRTADVRSLYYILKRQDAKGQLPEAFQMYGGCAAQVFYDGGLLAPIDDLWADDRLEDVFPPVIRDLNRLNGHYYSVPVNVHRTNVVWYNKPLLDKHQIDPEKLTTWDAFFGAAEVLRAAGVKSPIQLGVTWTAKALFEGIVASLGIATYEDWVNGKLSAPDDPRLMKAWTIFGRYLSYVNEDHGDVEWDAAVRRVMSGEAAFYVMGDWADGEFRSAGMKFGRDYGAFAVPGTKGMFGFGVDTFQHPKGIVDEANSIRWLRLVASREGQDAFNPLKGSISARSDTDVTRYGPYQRMAIADMRSARSIYPTTGAGLSEAYNTHLMQDLATFMVDRDVEKAAAALASASTLLTGRNARSWQLK